jgi:myo-inositol-hexaphosphate 3-phosphohydrolase
MNVTSGTNACANWPNLSASSSYEWYVEVSDSQSTTTGPVWTFTTPASLQPITKSAQMIDEEAGQVKGRIVIYPNPAPTKSFRIQLNELNTKKIMISIYDMNGKLCQQNQYGSTNNITVDHHLPSGLYTVKIVTENFTANRKLVIQ